MITTDVKNILGLQLPTDPRWVDLAGISMEDILTDHAYCEQKAALTCISLIQKYPEKEMLVKELAPIVTEEWGHFRLVLGFGAQTRAAMALSHQRNSRGAGRGGEPFWTRAAAVVDDTMAASIRVASDPRATDTGSRISDVETQRA